MTTVASRNLYIDSEISSGGNQNSFRLTIPPSSFSCKPNQMMKLSLLNWEMRKNWYEVNQTNNVFWIQTSVSGANTKYYPVIIPPGSYRSFGTTATAANTVVYNSQYGYAASDLCSALAYAINKTLSSIHTGNNVFDHKGNLVCTVAGYTANTFFAAIPSTTVTFNAVTRQFAFALPTLAANRTIDKFVFFQCKNGVPSGHPMAASISAFNSTYGDPAFQDTHELLGAIPTRDDIAGQSSTTGGLSGSASSWSSPYVGQLNTLEAVYLRLLSMGTNNFQSPSLDRNVPNNYGLVPTNIFARIPLPGAVYDDVTELLTFTEQGSGTFSCMVDARQLQLLEFSVTDDKGRPIQEVLAGQTASGQLSYKITVKWEVIQFDQSLNTLPPSLDIQKSLAVTGFVRPSDDYMKPSTAIPTILKKPGNHQLRSGLSAKMANLTN